MSLRRLLTLGLLSLSVLLVSGCDDLELPFQSESNTADETDSVETTLPPASDPAPAPEPPPQATAESVLSALQSKPSVQVTDQDLLKFAEVESGLEIVTELNLKGARLSATGLQAVAALPALVALDLEGARIGDDDWQGLAGATGLARLNLKKSSINNTSISAVGQLTGLQVLDLSDTRVSDPGFVHLQQLSALEELYLNNLRIEGAGLEALGEEGARAPLRVIHANATNFGYLGFVHIGEFAGLQELVATSASVSDNSLDGLKMLDSIVHLNLSGNQHISDQGLKSLTRQKQLELLNLDGIQTISDFTLKQLGRCGQLKELRISDSACTLEGVEKFKKRVPACVVYLKGQQL